MRSMIGPGFHGITRIVLVLAAASIMATESWRPSSASPQGITGAGASLITVQNLDSAVIGSASVDFYRNGSSSPPVTLAFSGILPGAGMPLYLPTRVELTNGSCGAYLQADTPFVATTRTQWLSSGGVASYPAVAGSNSLIIPYFVIGPEGHVSLFSVQSLETSASVEATIEVFAAVGGAPVLRLTKTLPPGGSITFDPSRDPDFIGLGSFVGWARLTADRPITAHSIVDVERSEKGVYAFAATPEYALTRTLAVPLVLRDASLTADDPGAGAPAVRFDTWFALANPGGFDATIRLTATGLPCVTEWPGSEPIELTLPAGASVRLSGEEIVPISGGCGAAVMIDSSAPLAGVVIMGATDNSLWGAHSLSLAAALPESRSSIYLPFAQAGRDLPDSDVMSVHPPGRLNLDAATADEPYRLGLPILGAGVTVSIPELGILPGFRSSIVVHNPNDDPINVSLKLFAALDGKPDAACGSACDFVIGPSESIAIRLTELGVAIGAYTGLIAADGRVYVTTMSDSANGVEDLTLDGGLEPLPAPDGSGSRTPLGISVVLK